ncbi:MAG: biopolymer transporter ExbD [Candidatus Dadabacteria bacterium]|nr:MAG: biopolymer transporter ExbD [Candidatus Dadabacteria bacterium]
MKWFRRTKEPYIFSVTPLIDIMFLLLLFYMLTSSFAQKEAIKVSVPTVGKSEKVEKRVFKTVVINSNGDLFFEDTSVNPLQLKEKLLLLSKDTFLLIKADKKAPVQSLASLLSTLKEVGLKKVSLEVKEDNLTY